MKNSDNINDQFRFFCETLEDGDYLVSPEQSGAYDMLMKPTYVTVADGKIKYIYHDVFCGGGLEGFCYRSHRNDMRVDYPARLKKSKDISKIWLEISKQWPFPLDFNDFVMTI